MLRDFHLRWSFGGQAGWQAMDTELENGVGSLKQVPQGVSWTGFFFTGFAMMARGMFAKGLACLALFCVI